MSYKKVKEVLNKVVAITNQLKNIDSDELVKKYKLVESSNRDVLIKQILKMKLSPVEYDIYDKYCSYYRVQREQEVMNIAAMLGEQIDELSSLYDERQDILRNKYLLENEKESIKRHVLSLPWIRLKIDYDRLESEHKKLVRTINGEIIQESQINDEIADINRRNFIVRARNKGKIVGLKEKKAELKKGSRDEILKLKRNVRGLFIEYLNSIRVLVTDALSDKKLFELMRDTRFCTGGNNTGNTRDEQVSLIVDEFVNYTDKENTKYTENYTSCIEEGVFPPVGRLEAISPDDYREYLTKFLCLPIDEKIGRCSLDASQIMSRIRSGLERQKDSIDSLNDRTSHILSNRETDITLEEEKIFSLVYKDSK